jgi:hypothetical protein
VRWFFLVQLISFVASLPFFYLDGGIRLTAATFPFTAAAIVLILSACKSASALPKSAPVQGDSYAAIATAALIVVASLVAPQIGKTRNFEADNEPISCGQEDRPARMLVGTGTAHVNILDDDKAKSELPNIRRSDFRVSQSNELLDFWQTLDLPATIVTGLDHVSGVIQTVVGPPGLADGPRRLAALCTKPLRYNILSARIAEKDG